MAVGCVLRIRLSEKETDCGIGRLVIEIKFLKHKYPIVFIQNDGYKLIS